MYGSCCSGSNCILLNLSSQILFSSKNVLSSCCVDTPSNKVFVFSNSSNCGVVYPVQRRLKMEIAVRHCDQKKKILGIRLYASLCKPLATWLTSAVKVKFQSVWNQLMEPVVEHSTCIHLLYQDTQEDTCTLQKQNVLCTQAETHHFPHTVLSPSHAL